MSNNNPLSNQSYINKDFQTIYPELLDLVKKLTYKWDPTISNESDPGVLLIKLNAIIADKNNYNIDKNVLECFPDTVTQYQNAYKLYSQLGYNMHWYKSAKGEISFKWKSEKITVSGYTASVKIPQFTMVTDENKEIVYTTLDECVVDTDGAVSNVEAIQGVIRDYAVGSDTLLSPTVLDYRNRLYFPVSNVAENGIFISDANKDASDNYNFVWRNPDTNVNTGWRAVDNLYIQPMGTKCYQFGIDQTNSTCYIEFPEDITNLMGEGIFVKYIQSEGDAGNISGKRISQFYNDVEIEALGETMNITQDVLATNYSSINNGKDPETIDSAYINYKKNVGTFDTLVTLRDYLNYIVNDEFELVSNGVVADRTNDIQSSYKIVTTKDGVTTIKPVIAQTVTTDKIEKLCECNKVVDFEVSTSTDELSAFDLKTYFLEYSKWPKFITSVDVESQKADFKKAYDKSFKLQLNTIGENSELATPEVIKDYYEGAKRIEHDFVPKIADINRPLLFKNKFKLNLTIIPNNVVTQAQADEIEKNVYEAVLKNLSSNKINFGEEISYETVYDICNNADSRIKAIALDSLEYVPYAVIYIDENVDTSKLKAVKEDWLTELTLVEGLNEIPIPPSVSKEYDILEGYDYFTALTLNEQIALDICAKNVLAGTTPLYHPNKSFTRTLEQQGIQEIKELEKVTTNSVVTFRGLSTNNGAPAYIYAEDGEATAAESVILPNEAMFLYAPNLIEDITYSSSIKYLYYTLPTYTGKDAEYIPANVDYILDKGQVLFMFWKTEDSKDSPYQYAKYTEGTILKSSVKIIKSNVSDYSTICSTLESSGYEGEGQVLGTLNDSLYNISDTLLSTTKNIVIKKLNQLEFKNAHNYCYWITNDIITENGKTKYQLTMDYVEPTTQVISRSFQSGLVYVSNFIWNMDGSNPKTLNSKKKLVDDEKVYILRPNVHTIKYNAKNNSGELYVEEQVVTDYIVEEILEAGTVIKCTGDMYTSKSGTEGKKDMYDYVSSKNKGDIILWGAIKSSNAVFSYNDNVDNVVTPSFSVETFRDNVDMLCKAGSKYRVTYDGTQWRCVRVGSMLTDPTTKSPMESKILYCKEDTETDSYLISSDNKFSTTLWKCYPAKNYIFQKYDYFEIVVNYGDEVEIDFYHTGDVGDAQVAAKDEIVSTFSASQQYILTGGYRIDVIDESSSTQASEYIYEYVLKSGEYFFYTDADKKSFEMLSDGTKLSIKVKQSPEEGKYQKVYKVSSMDLSKITEEQLSAFDDNSWYDFKYKEDSNDNEVLTITENQILVLGEGTGVRVSLDSLSVPYYSPSNGWGTKNEYDTNLDSIKIDSNGITVKSSSLEDNWREVPGVLSNYTLQYRATTDESWTELPRAVHPKLSWDGYMILNLNSGPNNPQKLDYRHSQSMEFSHRGVTEGVSNPVTLISTNKDEVYFQTSSTLNISGGKNVDITGVNVDDEIVYMDLLTYNLTPLVGNFMNSQGTVKLGEISADEEDFVVTIHPTGDVISDGTSYKTGTLTIRCEIEENTILPIEFVNEYDLRYFSVTTYTSPGDSTPIEPNLFLGYDKGGVLCRESTIAPGVYYFKIAQKVSKITFNYNNIESKDVSFRLKPLFAYKYEDSIIDDDKKIVQYYLENRVNALNRNNMFDYTYEPIEDVKINNPLSSKSYFDSSHICNKFTIPQVSDIKIKTMNKRS